MSSAEDIIKYVIPKYDGVTVIECKEVPLKSIVRKKNDGRASDFDHDKVMQIEHAIANGQWAPMGHEPPMVTDNGDGTYTLKTGNHRYMGHKGAGQTKMWVAVVVFESKRVEAKVRNLENAQETQIFVKNYRSAEDIIKSAAEILSLDEDEREEETTEKDIKNVLKELLADKHSEYEYIFTELKMNHGIRNSVTALTDDDVDEYINNNRNNNSVAVTQLFRTKEGAKADERAFFNVLREKVEHGSDAPVTVYGYFTRMTAEDVIYGRTTRKDAFENNKEKFLKMMETVTASNFTNPDFEFLPQLDGVEVNVD